MQDFWQILQIEPTTDREQIKRAYAQQSKNCNPEEKPEEFMRLRDAYQQALSYTQQQNFSVLEAQQEEYVSSDKPVAFFFSEREAAEENPYRESAGYQAFLKLYQKQNQKNWKAWMEYVTSPAFLEVFHEEAFCSLLLETVQEKDFRPGAEFVKSLYIAYRFTGVMSTYVMPSGEEERRYQFRQEADGFPVPEPILAIARMVPAPRHLTGNDYAMMAAFSNYYHLRVIEEGIGWGEQGLHGLRLVLKCYVMSYIKDNCPERGMSEYARHPLGLRLLDYFFASAALTEECYRIAWETLSLKQVVMGRSKLFYGRLREICIEKCPELAEEKQESFQKLNEAFMTYMTYGDCLETATAVEQQAEAFFSREDLQRALVNRKYVEENVVVFWISHHMSQSFLRHLRAFYEMHPTAPCARQILQEIDKAEIRRRIFLQDTEDTQAPADKELISMSYRPFLRYWLNTAFLNCFELCKYLGGQLSYAPDWANRFLGAGRSVAVEPVCYRVMVDNVETVLQMHRYYIEYQAHGQELYTPFLSYEKLLALDTNTFFLLLPMADVSAVETDSLAQELERRLAKTALPLENIKDVAYFLSIGLVEAPILTIYRESADILYSAEWQQEEQRLYFFQQEDGMRSAVPDGRSGIATEEEAVVVAKRLLADLVAPPPIDCSCLQPEPETVYVSSFYAPMEILTGEAITVEALNALLVQFAQGGLKRLEFAFACCQWELKFEETESYPRKRSLVFLHNDNRYAVMYFDDTENFFYVLQQRTESIGALGEEFVSVDKKLPEQCLFYSFFPVQCHLQQILIDSANARVKQNHGENMGDCKWLTSWGGVFVADRRIKYNLAKREIGKFPLERAYNPVELPIAVSDFITVNHNLIRRPVAEMEQWNLHGERRTAEINSNQKFILK